MLACSGKIEVSRSFVFPKREGLVRACPAITSYKTKAGIPTSGLAVFDVTFHQGNCLLCLGGISPKRKMLSLLDWKLPLLEGYSSRKNRGERLRTEPSGFSEAFTFPSPKNSLSNVRNTDYLQTEGEDLASAHFANENSAEAYATFFYFNS